MYNDIGPVLKITLFLGLLPPELRPFGLMFEEPRATYLPEEIGKWCGGNFYFDYRTYAIQSRTKFSNFSLSCATISQVCTS